MQALLLELMPSPMQYRTTSLGLKSLKPGSNHPHLHMPLEDGIREVERGNLDSTRWITKKK